MKNVSSQVIDPKKKAKQLRICGKWAQLSRKLVEKHEKLRQLAILGRWSKLIGGLVRKDDISKPLKTTAMERWGVLAGKALHKIRQERGEVSWLAGTKAMKEGVLAQNRKMRTMATLGRWKRLIDGVRAQAASKKSMVIACKWRRVVNLLLAKDTKKAGADKTRTLEIYGRWRKLTRGVLDLSEGQQPSGPKRLAICAKWFQMADRMLRIHDPAYRKKRVQQRWTRVVARLFGLGKLGADDSRKWKKIFSG